MADIPVVKLDLGNLAEPAKVLIAKISGAVGGIFKPWQMIRVAKAEAEIDRIRADSEIEITDLHRRAARRWLEEEAKKQANIEGITEKALPLLEEGSAPQDVSDDWITNFFDKSRTVSDEEMQQLWSRVLAGEANAPGGFSRKTVNIMGDLNKCDAELFTNLLGFVWIFGEVRAPLVFDAQEDIYRERGITFASLSHLQSLGLIRLDMTGVGLTVNSKKLDARYFDEKVQITLPKDKSNSLDVGTVMLTRAGYELSQVCNPEPVDGFFDFAYKKWSSRSLVPKQDAEEGAASAN